MALFSVPMKDFLDMPANSNRCFAFSPNILIACLFYADDVALLSETELQYMLDIAYTFACTWNLTSPIVKFQ